MSETELSHSSRNPYLVDVDDYRKKSVSQHVHSWKLAVKNIKNDQDNNIIL